MKKILITITFSFILQNIFSQDSYISKHFFRSWGVPIADAYQSPVQVFYYQPMGWAPDTFYERHVGITLLGFQYNFRFNVININENNALSISTVPMVSFSMSDLGIGTFNNMFLLNYEMGVGSTYECAKDGGAFLGIGYEIIKGPLILVDGNIQHGAKVKSFFGQPVMAAGYRFWSRNNKLKELGLKVGQGKSTPFKEYGDTYFIDSRSWSFRLYYSGFINF